MLGLGKTPSPSSKTNSKTDVNNETNKNTRKVTFNSEKTNSNNPNENVTTTVGGSSGRQLVPGLLLMQDHSVNTGTHFSTPTKNGIINCILLLASFLVVDFVYIYFVIIFLLLIFIIRFQRSDNSYNS